MLAFDRVRGCVVFCSVGFFRCLFGFLVFIFGYGGVRCYIDGRFLGVELVSLGSASFSVRLGVFWYRFFEEFAFFS